ncbi:precorrin-2 dehydrogenase/sirohydrochlorin ferrochelatase family protein [Maribellus maritimus]|uniref:precorrin-2 dehydrogenase/sirohydrochlorin ferrochelatase family protein n=1 Tax=Maribellus maritimus TaxID=2870838 RepID=UPI001EEA4728|nr:bifunctional precorrin-2 dehydrogenase/sirohydrochlorin ferrochelatase [Maribellus maritimus]MCG6186861.1 bifunctional precorrin-2 dehydrogenase/sirohydrochlorin ferrochelatase [Maribellus maritimus]
MKKNFLPISINIEGQKILIIGGGESAFKKIKILQRFGAEVEVLAIDVSDEIKQSGIKYFETAYQKKHLTGYLMLYSCTNNYELDKQILSDGEEMGVLVNIHDKPELCQFVSPAIYKNGKMTVAVASNGEDVYESIRLRNKISEFLTDNFHKN